MVKRRQVGQCKWALPCSPLTSCFKQSWQKTWKQGSSLESWKLLRQIAQVISSSNFFKCLILWFSHFESLLVRYKLNCMMSSELGQVYGQIWSHSLEFSVMYVFVLLHGCRRSYVDLSLASIDRSKDYLQSVRVQVVCSFMHDHSS